MSTTSAPSLTSYCTFAGHVVNKLKDHDGEYHSLLVAIQTNEGEKVGRLPLDELRGKSLKDWQRRILRLQKGDPINVAVPPKGVNPRNNRFLLSERLAIVRNIVRKLNAKGSAWREDCPEPTYTSYRRNGWCCQVNWESNGIRIFRLRPHKAA